MLAKTDRTGSVDRVDGTGVVIEHATPSLSWNERRRPDYISPTLCPPNSLDLNVVDYSIWSVLQEFYHSRITGLEERKTRLIVDWAKVDQLIIDAAVGQWRRRLCACVSARGAHFEHKF